MTLVQMNKRDECHNFRDETPICWDKWKRILEVEILAFVSLCRQKKMDGGRSKIVLKNKEFLSNK